MKTQIEKKNLTRPRYQRVKLLYGQKPSKLSYHPVKFGSQRHSGSRGIMFLVCYKILTKWRHKHLLDSAHLSQFNSEFDSNINSYINTLEKTYLTASVGHIGRSSKSGIPVYNSEVLDTIGRKTRRRRKYAIAKRCAFHKNAVSELYIDIFNTYLNIYSAHLKNMIEMKNLEVDGYLSKQNLFVTYIAFP